MKRINSFQDFLHEAKDLKPLKTALLSPEDEEVVAGIKDAVENKIITPVFIGNKEKIISAAKKVGFDVSKFQIIEEDNRMNIALKGAELFYQGDISLVCKGQIPTSYVYRSIIRNEKEINKEARISVFSIWDMTSPQKLILLTDTGANIHPDWKTKATVLRDAVNFMEILGYNDLKALGLTAAREINKNPQSLKDIENIKEFFKKENVPCQIQHGENLSPFFNTKSDDMIPEIILVPNVETGNIVVKLDFFLEIERFSVVMTSKGPVIVPSRSDTAHNVFRQLVVGAVISHRQKNWHNISEVQKN